MNFCRFTQIILIPQNVNNHTILIKLIFSAANISLSEEARNDGLAVIIIDAVGYEDRLFVCELVKGRVVPIFLLENKNGVPNSEFYISVLLGFKFNHQNEEVKTLRIICDSITSNIPIVKKFNPEEAIACLLSATLGWSRELIMPAKVFANYSKNRQPSKLIIDGVEIQIQNKDFLWKHYHQAISCPTSFDIRTAGRSAKSTTIHSNGRWLLNTTFY